MSGGIESNSFFNVLKNNGIDIKNIDTELPVWQEDGNQEYDSLLGTFNDSPGYSQEEIQKMTEEYAQAAEQVSATVTVIVSDNVKDTVTCGMTVEKTILASEDEVQTTTDGSDEGTKIVHLGTRTVMVVDENGHTTCVIETVTVDDQPQSDKTERERPQENPGTKKLVVSDDGVTHAVKDVVTIHVEDGNTGVRTQVRVNPETNDTIYVTEIVQPTVTTTVD